MARGDAVADAVRVRPALVLAALTILAGTGCGGSRAAGSYRASADGICRAVVSFARAKPQPKAGTPAGDRFFRRVVRRRGRALARLAALEAPAASRLDAALMLRSFRRSQRLLVRATRRPGIGEKILPVLIAAARANDPGNRAAKRLGLPSCGSF